MQECPKLEHLLKLASAQDTCWPGCAQKWTPQNPTCGHCVMYALYVHRCFEGDIIRVEAVLPDGSTMRHYFNRVHGQDVDLSRSQFPMGTEFRDRTKFSHEAVLALRDKESERYDTFRDRVERLRMIENNPHMKNL